MTHRRLVVYRRVITEAWGEASQDVKDEVEVILQEEREAAKQRKIDAMEDDEGEGEGEGKHVDHGGGCGGLNEMQCAVLAYTDAMTVGVRVSDEVFARLRRWFDERAVVEVTATVAAYNCVSRFLVALDVGEVSERKVG